MELTDKPSVLLTPVSPVNVRAAPLEPVVPPPALAPELRAPSWLSRTDPVAIAALVCGFTAIIPVFSQLAGLGLGISSLVRIRRARRAGVEISGAWAAGAGIGISGVFLICWLFIIGVMLWAGSMFQQVGGQLPSVTGGG